MVFGLHFSVCLAFLPDGRLLVTEHHTSSKVMLVTPGPPATVSVVGKVDSVRVSGEQGLLGIAVDPRWPAKPYVYVHYAYNGAARIHISRYTVLGDLTGSGNGTLTLDSLSRYHIIVSLPDSTIIHNGGQVHFGPDSMLYISVGDDGRSCGAQARERLMGKILRLDVLDLPPGPGGPPPFAEITPADNPFVAHSDPRAHLVWAFGLRNPYSFTIDPPTGHIVIADVGAGLEEEIDLATSPGINFGWPLYEGFSPGIQCVNADTMGVSPERPLYSYARGKGAAIISGGLYRPVPGGESSFPPEYEGSIFLSDVYQGFLRRLVLDGAQWRLADSVAGQPSATDWGRDYDGVTTYTIGPDGALWYAKYAEQYTWVTGEIRRIRWTGPPAATASNPLGGTRLEPPAPLPARNQVRLAWQLDRPGHITLEAFDVTGARVRRMVAGLQPDGPGAINWDLTDDRGRRLPPGLYFVALTSATGRDVRRVVLAR